MLQRTYATRLFILCTSLCFTTPLLSEISTASPNTQADPAQQLKDRAVELEKLKASFFQAFTKVQNKIAETIKFTKKYAKDIDKSAVTQKMLEASSALDRFCQMKMRSIQHYLQQNPTTIPDEGYQEIYETVGAILTAAMRLAVEFDAHVQSNFSTELNFNFLISKDALSLVEEGITPAMLATRCAELDAATESLFESTNAIGLTLKNKIARTIDKFIVRPCAKYHILPIAIGGTFFVASTLFLYWVGFCKHHKTKGSKDADDLTSTQLEQALKNDTTSMKITRIAPPEEVKTQSTTDATNNVTSANTSNPAGQGWFAQFRAWLQKTQIHQAIEKWCGPVPEVTRDGLWNLDGAEKRAWNSTAMTLYNLLHHNPISTAILGVYAWAWDKKVNPHILPAISTKIQTWWQQALGGRYLEMQQQQHSFECPIQWTFDQVIGLEHVKARFAAALAYAEDPAKYAQIGKDVAMNYVFHGVKRTGKSFFAVALAGEMKRRNPNMRILKIPAALFSHGVEATIDLIRAHAPCVVFVDEIDIAGLNRMIDRATTGELLKSLGDGNLSPSPDRPVFLLFATNKIEAIDTSLNSLGRFGPSILFNTPTFMDRIQFVDEILRSNGCNAENFDIHRLAERTEGNSFEDIKYCISDAALRASSFNIPLTTELIMEVMNEILNGVYPEYPFELHPETLKVIATHYAGKAIISMLMPSHELLDTISIHKRKLPLVEEEHASLSGKPTEQKKYEYGMLITRQTTNATERLIMTPELQKAYYTRIFAGSVAEEIMFGRAVNKCDNQQLARAHADLIVQVSEGLCLYDYMTSPEQKGEFAQKARDLVNEYKQAARELLTQHRKALDTLVRLLLIPIPELGAGTVSDGLVNMVLSNPDAVSAQLDEIEAELKKEMEKQQAEYERMMRERSGASSIADQSSDKAVEAQA